MAIRAGKLRHEVTIEAPTDTQDATGAATVTWSTFATVWAGFEPLTGREYFEAAARRAEATGRFWLRELAGVTTRMRVDHAGAHYDIDAVIPPEKPGGYLQLMVRDAA